MASLEHQQQGISSDHLVNQSGTNIDDVQCAICLNVLWKPVACQTCETVFCDACIRRWLTKNPKKCPNQCQSYVERKCPPLTAKLLGRLQLTCSYRANGCQQIIPYDALEKHEMECGYQQQQCPGCRSQILKKDIVRHTSTCAFIELVCDECDMKYKRGAAATEHTEIECLKTQLRQVRKQCKEMSMLLNTMQERITFNDLPDVVKKTVLPSIYKGLEWNDFYYDTESHFMKSYLESGYVTTSLLGSSPYIVYSTTKSEISARDWKETFSLVSLTAHAAWNDTLSLIITSYRNSTRLSSHEATLIFGTPQRISLEWKNIDRVTLDPSESTFYLGTAKGRAQFVLTEVIVI